MGLAGRALGLMLDRVVGFDVVTADGKRRAREREREPGPVLGAARRRRQLRAGHQPSTCAPPRGHRRLVLRSPIPASARGEVLAAWDDLIARRRPTALTSICTAVEQPRRPRSASTSAAGRRCGGSSRRSRASAGRELQTAPRQLDAAADALGGLRGVRVGRACRNVPRTTFDASSVYIAKSLGSAARAAFVRGRGRRRDADLRLLRRRDRRRRPQRDRVRPPQRALQRADRVVHARSAPPSRRSRRRARS